MNIKWIVGYVDSYGKIHHTVVHRGDNVDSHRQLYPSIHHNKWRWVPEFPKHLNTYNHELDEEVIYNIWNIIEKCCIYDKAKVLN